MDDKRIDTIVTLCMLKLRFQYKMDVILGNIAEKSNGICNIVLNVEVILNSIKRLKSIGHVKEEENKLLLRSGIVFYYIEILVGGKGMSINESLEFLERRLVQLEAQKAVRYDI
jgi:hypothetical protein